MEIQIQNELNELLDVIDLTKEQPIWPGTFLAPSVINVLWTFTAGERISRQDERLTRLLNLLNLRSKAFDMSGGILNQMAWLRHVAPEKTGYNLIKRFNQELHEFFMASIQSHKADYNEGKATDDLIYAYIKAMQDNEAKSLNFTDVQLTMIILDIFIAGSQVGLFLLQMFSVFCTKGLNILDHCHYTRFGIKNDGITSEDSTPHSNGTGCSL